MPLYKETPSEELKCYRQYKIYIQEPHDYKRTMHYYIGRFICSYAATDSGIRLNSFWNVKCVMPYGSVCMSPCPMDFLESRVYKRVITDEEVKRANREAFEKRAVNQILSSILGHRVQLY